MDVIGLYRPGTNIASIKRNGPYGVMINLKTPDSQFIAANLNAQFIVPKHIWSKVADVATFTNPNPVGSGPVHEDHPVHDAGLRPQQEPEVLGGRRAEDPVRRVRAGVVERRGAAADPERPGRLDAQLRAERRVGVHREGPQHFHSFYATTAYPISLMLDTTQYPYSLVAAAQGDQHGDRPEARSRSSVSTATRRRPTRSA